MTFFFFFFFIEYAWAVGVHIRSITTTCTSIWNVFEFRNPNELCRKTKAHSLLYCDLIFQRVLQFFFHFVFIVRNCNISSSFMLRAHFMFLVFWSAFYQSHVSRYTWCMTHNQKFEFKQTNKWEKNRKPINEMQFSFPPIANQQTNIQKRKRNRNIKISRITKYIRKLTSSITKVQSLSSSSCVRGSLNSVTDIVWLSGTAHDIWPLSGFTMSGSHANGIDATRLDRRVHTIDKLVGRLQRNKTKTH